ncbi:MAG: helix-turn-helix domain-containing protein [Treponema sp.]|jgi:transcriptional regulator with XRE-family HTH domain|nr:helix-turn-helix domain-containing protein [Treponema sp.]
MSFGTGPIVSKSEVNMAVCERIRRIRKALGLSQLQFGQNMGLSQGHVGALETNVRRVSDRIIKMISMTYGASESWLRDESGPMWEADRDPRLEHIWRTFKTLDPLLQDCVLQHLDILAAYQKKKTDRDGPVKLPLHSGPDGTADKPR